MVKDPILLLLLRNDTKVYQIGKLPLNGSQGKASLVHDFPLIKGLSRKSVEKTKDPGSCDRSKEFV